MQIQPPYNKPFSQSSEENKDVILKIIAPLLADRQTLLEIASGTGQHAVFFAEQMPQLTWQTSDLLESHSGIKQWLNDANLPNVLPPFQLNVSEDTWPNTRYDAVFSANSFHIMGEHNVEDFFKNVSKVLNDNALVLIYGPFNYNGQFTSDSNANFDIWLKNRNPQSGIKDFEWCDALANKAGLTLLDDFEMPMNNRILVWKKSKKRLPQREIEKMNRIINEANKRGISVSELADEVFREMFE
ncbi:hypothetical protein THMIRHAM_12840 [Thiomicrorhabdus immobilis]|uniref:DUF938 domain-containing protein n=1 Tax=Thiomicrorhabdus immobilis TaxID=2791037 RepID=A0ABM7MDJ5_9GAMM|nr:DUF938 domain-containing protein [Thiomicrorhabdus immobilis]BCN93499.1 hypothetical protein THMIRHAM_12840 [Thiomicrorhabdus immobilis]